MSLAKLGTTLSEETKEAMSVSALASHIKDPTLGARRAAISSANYANNPEQQQKMSEIRTEYWSHEENRESLSKTLTDLYDGNQELRDYVGQKVKESFEKPEVKEKMKKFYKTREKAIIRSDDMEFDSLKAAAEATNTSSSSIVRQIQGKYKTAGGYTWKYKELISE